MYQAQSFISPHNLVSMIIADSCELGSAAAANCMASSFREGDAIGAPFHTDIPQSFAWHLFAARAGYHNSQYDLGWLLLSGRATGVAKEQAEDNDCSGCVVQPNWIINSPKRN